MITIFEDSQTWVYMSSVSCVVGIVTELNFFVRKMRANHLWFSGYKPEILANTIQKIYMRKLLECTQKQRKQ